MKENSTSLPVKGDLKPVFTGSVILALLMAAASAAGLAFSDSIYPTAELMEGFFTNDLINLVIGLPVLLGSLWAARRGKLIGLLFWSGALFFVLYTYIVYAIAMPLNGIYLIYRVLVLLSIYLLVELYRSLETEKIQGALTGRVSERFSAGVLVAFGVIFILRVAGMVYEAIGSGTPIPW